MRNALEHPWERLQTYYRTHCASEPSSETGAPSNLCSFQKVGFMARYKKWARVLVDEIEELFKLPQGAFDNYDPIQ
jgi:hypothetical protein